MGAPLSPVSAEVNKMTGGTASSKMWLQWGAKETTFESIYLNLNVQKEVDRGVHNTPHLVLGRNALRQFRLVD